MCAGLVTEQLPQQWLACRSPVTLTAVTSRCVHKLLTSCKQGGVLGALYACARGMQKYLLHSMGFTCPGVERRWQRLGHRRVT